jgi:hypothetical protein
MVAPWPSIVRFVALMAGKPKWVPVIGEVSV